MRLTSEQTTPTKVKLRSILAKRRYLVTLYAYSYAQRRTKVVYTLTILPDARTGRERFVSGCPCTHCVHCVGFVRYTQTTSGCVRSGREGFASGWLCSVNARVDASDASGRERCTVYPCLLTDLFISTDTIHMTRKGDICHELSTCNWVTTGREADAVCTRRSGRVPFASGQSFVVLMQTRR